MNKLWIQKQNILPEGMPQKMNYQKRVIKESIDILNEERRPNRNKEKLKNIKNNEFQRSSSSKIMDEVSPYAKTMLLKIGKHIKKIKLRRSSSEIISGNKTFNKNFEYITNKNENNKKEDYVKNFVYVNDNYRKQLNFAFLKYNPISHLDNLKILVQAEPSIRKDIIKINQEVEEDIKWKCDKYHFLKKYLNLLARNERSRSVQKMQENENQNKTIKDNLLPNINNKNKNKAAIKAQKSVSSIYKQVNLLEKLNKKEMMKINAQKEQTQEEINHMLNASKEINDLIRNENINDKIEMFKTDYAKQMYYPGHESNSENLLEKDYFMDEKKKIVDKIGTVYSFKMNKTVCEKEKIFKGKINNENEKFKKRITDGKRNTMEEFNNYMINNQVRLPDDKNDDSL